MSEHTTEPTTVQLDGITKEYASLRAVEDVDFDVTPGEFLVIVGPSGCGKSTTLRMIAGLETVTDGELFFDDERVTDLGASERNVAMVFQNYALYPHMSARRNITFGMSEFDDEEIADRVENAAEILDITDLLDRKPKELSGGERQRVALGRAICRDPDVFLMDEPLSNLDAKLRVQMRGELARLHDELGTTTIYVTHDQTEAMTLGDRVAVLDDGQLQQVDPPQQLYDFPQNRFVAEFIGDPAMNMLSVNITDQTAEHDGFSIPLPEYDGFEGSALLGLRPEDIKYVRESEPDNEAFKATVTVTEPLGDTVLFYCQTPDGTEFKVQSEPRLGVESGDEITLSYDPDRLHVFDPDSGEAVYHSAETAGATRAEQQAQTGDD
ncbi:ABC transporter ATP-binding protein [Halovenus sp. HT40]|uniref:ABC transporter ATP-binding protein n=1 Tax=Halovenus sp. HT40 TaxID=3126691 RepID=UPI00300F69E5